MTAKISPSLMCADMLRLGDALKIFEANNIDYVHIDIMDGHFVPNFTLGTDFCAEVKKNCKIPLDIHLMVERPEEKLEWFPFGEGDIVSVHTESTPHLQKALAAIKARGAKAFAALNPSTGPNALDYVFGDLDGVVVMTVNPGFAGQKMIPSALNKISDLKEYLYIRGRRDVLIEADGNVSFENAEKMKAAGADIFVAGTSSVFAKNMLLSDGIAKMREVLK